MNDLINLSLGSAGFIALLGYAVVFMGLVMLMLVIMLTAAFMKRGSAVSAPAEDEAHIVPPVSAIAAPGTAGELKLYDTDPRDAAMIMAIVADKLNKPLNELRFISIREVK